MNNAHLPALILMAKMNNQIDLESLLGQALAMCIAGDFSDAKQVYEEILASAPNTYKALTNLGSIELKFGNLEACIQLISKSLEIEPNQLNAYNNLGLAFQSQNRLNEALENFEKAICINNSYPELHYNLGITKLRLNQYAESISSFREAIRLKPDYADAYNNLGIVLDKLNQHHDAVENYTQSISLNPRSASTFFNRATTFNTLKQYDKALDDYDQAICLKPDYAQAHSSKVDIFYELRRYNEALDANALAISLDSDNAEKHFTHGLIFANLNCHEDALKSYSRAIELNPAYTEAQWNIAASKILLGDYVEGWKLYEWRWKLKNREAFIRDFTQPLWLGDHPIEGKKLLIYPEQGMGDIIQFSRYVSMLASMGANVILELPRPLASLMSTLEGEYTIIEYGRNLPKFDFQCPITSLPLAFKTTVETIPATVPYLYANSEKTNRWSDKLGLKEKQRVGLVWSGSTTHNNDHNRSLLLKQLEPIFQLSVEFHCLQKEIRDDDLEMLSSISNLNCHQDDLFDFSDTAALIDQMDIVISVDTSVAHLAGALGKTVWILLPFTPDYRWLLNRKDSPWYPTATLFRQPAIGDWTSVIHDIIEQLERYQVSCGSHQNL